jgi:hypothetical protein
LRLHRHKTGVEGDLPHLSNYESGWNQSHVDTQEKSWVEFEFYVTTDGKPASLSWYKAPIWGLRPDLYYSYDNYGFFSCGAPSLTRGRVWLLYMLLALASAIFLWSESLGTRDHILLSQIWDFPFRRLLRLAGSRWRYSIPPPHGGLNWTTSPSYIAPARTAQKRLCHYCVFSRCRRNVSTDPLLGNGCCTVACLYSGWLAMIQRVTIRSGNFKDVVKVCVTDWGCIAFVPIGDGVYVVTCYGI